MKKLSLNRETLRALAQDQISDVDGAGTIITIRQTLQVICRPSMIVYNCPTHQIICIPTIKCI